MKNTMVCIIMIHIIIAVIMMPGDGKENSAHFANKYHRIMESQNGLSWKGP